MLGGTRTRSKRGWEKKSSDPLPEGGPPAIRSAGERACAGARRRRPAPPSAEGGLAQGSSLPAPPQARRLRVVDSRPAERDSERFREQREKADEPRRKEKPVEPGEERGSRLELTQDTPPCLTPLGAAEVLRRLELHRSGQ